MYSSLFVYFVSYIFVSRGLFNLFFHFNLIYSFYIFHIRVSASLVPAVKSLIVLEQGYAGHDVSLEQNAGPNCYRGES